MLFQNSPQNMPHNEEKRPTAREGGNKGKGKGGEGIGKKTSLVQ
jgi:hypothetical protein